MRKDRDYLLFIRSKPCLICGDVAEPHHMRRKIPTEFKGGTSLKPWDLMCLPLCRDHHQEIEESYDDFEKLHSIDLSHAIIAYLVDYILTIKEVK